ncbi:hypothetical protein [Deinococcus ficus]|uniref:Uncharacterized protein n=1 Tax=Deinococcus ficus TaxID=317577 RepID=A0A221SVI3_9DEIO|nr:hypothetical protein [Deinococcus ficus]ASN80666.1 hypothetical protein DFI_06320 [Deinococcus ficus]
MTRPVIALQRLAYEWGPDGCSAALLAARRALPRHYPLPTLLPSGLMAVAQSVQWTDQDAFTHPHDTVQVYDAATATETAPLHVPGVHVTPDPHGRTLALRPAPTTGIPTAGRPFPLRPGQTARFEWNERLDTGTGPRYRHTIVNIGLCARALTPDLFTRLPDLYRSHMIQLRDRTRTP